MSVTPVKHLMARLWNTGWLRIILLLISIQGCRQPSDSSSLLPEDSTAYQHLIHKADSLERAGKPDLALEAYEAAKEAADAKGHIYNRIVLEGNIGRLYLRDLGDIGKAEKVLLHQEAELQEEAGLPDKLRVVNYLDLSGVYRRRFDLAHAEAYAMMAFNTLLRGQHDDSLLMSRTYAALGALNHQKDEADSAYSFLHLATAYYPAHLEPAMSNLDWLVARINRNNNEDLSQPIRQAVGRYWLDYYQQVGERDPFIRTDAYRLRSTFFWMMQMHDSCIHYADLAIKGYHGLGQVQPYPRAFTYAIKSGSLLAYGRFDEAYAALDSALWIRFGSTQDMSAFRKDIYAVDLLSSKAEAFLEEGITRHNLTKVLEAITIYDSIKVLVRHFAKWDTDGHIHNKYYTNFFDSFQVKACAYLYRATGSEEWLVRLHDVLASYKGELFLRERRIQEIRSTGRKGNRLFAAFLNNDSALEKALFEAGRKSFDERVGDVPRILQLYKEKRRLIDELEKDTSALLRTIRDINHITADELVAYAQEKNVAVISFYIGDRFYNHDSIYALLAHQGQLDLVSCRYDAALDRAIHFLRQAHRRTVSDPSHEVDTGYLVHSRYIFDQVLRPVLRYLPGERSLVLIPDGDLHQVAFEGLVMRYPTSSYGLTWSDPAIRYVVDSFHIGYAFSPDRLLPEREGERRFTFDLIGMAYTDTETLAGTDSLQLPELYGSYREIEVLKELYQHQTTRFISGYQLTRDHFFKYAPRARALHLSTHGQYLPGVDRSGMLFVRDGHALDEIYQYELRFAAIRPRLLVLSACDSGAGELVIAEGMMSIGRGFQATGSGQVISARWPVSDRASTDFFRTFYTSYRHTAEVATSFRDAQLALRSTWDRFAFPGYWAGYGLFI